MSVKLTDAQLEMMSAAAQREDRCLTAPETMTGAAVSKAGAKLMKLGFAREIHAKPGTPLWRRDETGRSFAVKLTAAGLKAIAVDEEPKDANEPGEASQPQLLPEAKNGVSLDDVGRHAPTAAPRDGSKLALMIDLLRRADGATIVDLTQATGWLAHTTRAAITGLRKRGYALIRERGSALGSLSTGSRAPLPVVEIVWPSRRKQATVAVTPTLGRSGRRDRHGRHGSQIRAGSEASDGLPESRTFEDAEKSHRG